MQDVLSLYPRLLVFSGIIVLFLIVIALMPVPSEAIVVSNPVQTNAAENSRKLSLSDCRLDQHAYAPTCSVQGRTIRVINF